jgi:hypothetical protein
MSSLIFYTNKDQVFVATDTLATTTNGEPFMFTTKAFIVPHLRMLICGTGMGGVLGRWFVAINDKMIVRGIDNLNYHTPSILNNIWSDYKKEFSIEENITTTVYHFGFSEEDGTIHSYAYRSTNSFKSESLQYGVGVKPVCQIPEGFEFPKDIIKMMDEQRAIQNTLPKNERVYIGGKIQIHHLTNNGFNAYIFGQFADYESDDQAIIKNYDASIHR